MTSITSIATIVERRKGEPVMLRECIVMNHAAFLERLEQTVNTTTISKRIEEIIE